MTFCNRNENTQVVSVFPHTTSTVTVTPSATGEGEIKCMVVDHLVGGMLTSYSVIEQLNSYFMHMQSSLHFVKDPNDRLHIDNDTLLL